MIGAVLSMLAGAMITGGLMLALARLVAKKR